MDSLFQDTGDVNVEEVHPHEAELTSSSSILSCFNCQISLSQSTPKVTSIFRSDKTLGKKIEINVLKGIETTFQVELENSSLDKRFLCVKCGDLLEKAYNAFLDFLQLTQHKTLIKLLSKVTSVTDSRKQKVPGGGGQVKLNCNLCGSHFSKTSFLRKHLKLAHGKEEQRAGRSKAPTGEELRCKDNSSDDDAQETMVTSIASKESVNSMIDKHPDDYQGNKKLLYTCPICDKRHSRRDFLEQHVRTHTQEKPYSCGSCKKTFTSPKGLDNHLITHSDARLYCCSLCGKTFKRLHHLNDHEKNHADLPRLYNCLICGKGFKMKKHFKSHQLSHQGTKEHQCHLCLKSFSRKDNLRQHLRNVHEKEEQINKRS